MSVNEKNCSGDIFDEELITYKRRRVYNGTLNPPEGSSCTERKRKTKEKDIGWRHGVMLKSAKQHWKCNYCGLTRRGGGVTRLKLHLIGHKDVRKCPSVPDRVVEEIARHLNLKEKIRPLRYMKWNGKKPRKERRAGPPRQFEEKEESVKEVDKVDSDESGYESDEPEKNPEDDTQEPNMDCMVDGHKSTDYEEVGAGENSEKCRNALVRIFNSDKFSLLCDLLRNNFRDENSAERSNFGFGEIDVKIKNGDYEKLPYLFYNDIMKIWKFFENVGQEMICLAASLSSISRANIEHEVGIDESDLDQSIDPCQAHYCNHCHCEITNNWGLVSCKGCDTSYHTSCINPLIHGSTSSWYCSACIGKKSDVPVASGADGTDSDKEDRSETVQPCITSLYRLCKICGTRADREREFLVCGHPECPYKYYHTSCLKKSKVGIKMQESSAFWFCPSCLCRVCQLNQDDPLIVLCDGCDEAYHIYCMNPPCDSVPKGKWYCGKCSMKREKAKGKRKNDAWGLGSRKCKKNVVVPNLRDNDGSKNEHYKKEGHSSMDLLMTAIDAVSAED